MKLFAHYFNNGGIEIITECGAHFFEKTPSNMTGSQHLANIKSALKSPSRWHVENETAQDSKGNNESITVPATTAEEAVAFANKVLPHDSKWIAIAPSSI